MHDQPSVAALVSSYDPKGMKYNAYTTIQPPRLETIDQLQYMAGVSVLPHYSNSFTDSELLIRKQLKILETLTVPLRDLFFFVMDCLKVNMTMLHRRRSTTSKVTSTSLSRAKFNYFQLPLTSFGRGEMCLRQSLL